MSDFKLKKFRKQLYHCLGNGKDAVFELSDAAILSRNPTSLAPGRVAQSFATVIARIGTPARFPKPRGKSPGWQKGKIRTKKIRFPLVKKGKGKARKSEKSQRRE